MTTYTVTTTNKSIDFSYTYENQTASQVKQIKARFAGNKAMKVTAVKEMKCYYRGQVVNIIEEKTNGVTLVNYAGYAGHEMVNTSELEYR